MPEICLLVPDLTRSKKCGEDYSYTKKKNQTVAIKKFVSIGWVLCVKVII
jgi:hypothetical protein